MRQRGRVHFEGSNLCAYENMISHILTHAAVFSLTISKPFPQWLTLSLQPINQKKHFSFLSYFLSGYLITTEK